MIKFKFEFGGRMRRRSTGVKIRAALGFVLMLASGAAAQALQEPASKPEQTMKQEATPRLEATGRGGPVEKKPQPPRERAWQALHEALTDDSAERRAKAVNALGLLTGNAEAEKEADLALKDEKYNVRVAAATALGSMHAGRSIPELEGALEDPEATVVLAAANALMLLRDMRSAYDVYYSVLTGSMRTNKGLIREQFRMLQDTKKMAELGFEEGIGFVPFAGFGYGVVKTVMKAEGEAAPVRAAAAKKLAHDPDPASGEALIGATQDKSWLVRVAALDAISQREDGALLMRVIPSLEDAKEDVRYMAAACVIHLSELPNKHKKAVKSSMH